MRAFRNVLVLSVCFAALFLLPRWWGNAPMEVSAASTSARFPIFGYILDNPTVTIAGAGVTTSVTSVSGVASAQLSWSFGTVGGSYSGCTVQANTSVDGVNWYTLGSAVSVSVSTNAVNAWTILAQGPTSSGVTTTTPSGSAATGFGEQISYTLACSGYGTRAPVTIKAIYK